jgi:hypothetical protein
MILPILDVLLVISSMLCGYILGLMRGARLERIAVLRHYHREFADSPSRSLLAFTSQILMGRHTGKRD